MNCMKSIREQPGMTDRWRWLWLATILALAAGIGCWHMNDGWQQYEFGPLYAVAHRGSAGSASTASMSDPLVPVPSWHDVPARAVIRYRLIYSATLYNF